MKRLIGFLLVLSSCGGMGGGGPSPQSDSGLTGIIAGESWSTQKSDVRKLVNNSGTEKFSFIFSDSLDFATCNLSNFKADRRISISIPAKVGTTDVSGTFGAVAFIHTEATGAVVKTIATQGTVTITEIIQDSSGTEWISGAVSATAYSGENVSGSFRVSLCP